MTHTPAWTLAAVTTLAAALGSAPAWAQSQPYPVAPANTADMGRVISSIPVLAQVAVPRQVCAVEQITTEGQKSGAGALMGSIAGGAMGNAVGEGSGRAVATMIGLVGGAILGNNIEGSPPARTHQVQTCRTETTYETRTQGYNVTYEYAGKQYTVQMPQDPGPWVQLRVSPVLPTPPQQGGSSGYISPVSGAPAVFTAPTVYTQETTYLVPPTSYIQPRAAYYPMPSPQFWLNVSSERYVSPHAHYPRHDGRSQWDDRRWR